MAGASERSGRGELRIGTSGWTYDSWRAEFYAGVPRRRWLAHCAETFTGLEINATFYRFPKPETYAGWHDRTPDGFAFAIKGHRSVTHYRRLAETDALIARQRDDSAPLGAKLAAVLWQLPPGLPADAGLLGRFIETLAAWPATRHAIEFRNESWFTDRTAEALAGGGIANVISDAPRWPGWERVTTDLVYVRLHGHEETYASEYGDAGLAPWAARIRAWRDERRTVHVYFDNDAGGAAPRDARRLLRMVG